MTIFSIVQSQIMQKKKPKKPTTGEKKTSPDAPENNKAGNPEK